MFKDDDPSAADFTEVCDAAVLSSLTEPSGVCSLAATSSSCREAIEPFPVDLTDVRDDVCSSLSASWEERSPMLSEEPASGPVQEAVKSPSTNGDEPLPSSADFRDVREECFPPVTEDRDDRFLVKVDADPSSVDFRDA